MKDEIKNLIESVEIYAVDIGINLIDYVPKSDFDRVVEKLTKWNKVEDCLPDGKIELDCICQGQRTHLCCFLGLGDAFIKAYFEKKKIVEWRYIY